MHLREEDLYLALDSEAPARSLHLAECDACQRRLADAQLFQGRLTALLSALDHRVRPLPSAAGIMTVSRKRALLRARRRRAIVGGIATALAASAAAAAISVPQLRALAQRLFAPASERQRA